LIVKCRYYFVRELITHYYSFSLIPLPIKISKRAAPEPNAPKSGIPAIGPKTAAVSLYPIDSSESPITMNTPVATRQLRNIFLVF
jgi:hypothetical protein